MEICRNSQTRSLDLLMRNAPFLSKNRKNSIFCSRFYLLAPEELYECVGDVPNVVFPCAALTDGDTGRIAIYYGCADTVTGLCFTTVDETLNFLKTHDLSL